MKIRNTVFILLLLLSAIFVFVSPVQGCAGWSVCATNCGELTCSDCTWCQQPSQPGESEDITGKITNPSLSNRLQTLPGAAFLGKFIRLGISLIFIAGTVIFFLTLLSGGVKWISAGSDKTHLEGAQKQITHALVGLAILFAGFAIIQLLEHLFGISLLMINLPTL